MAMKETQAIIERVRQVNDTHQHLVLSVDASVMALRAGQSLLAQTNPDWVPYLREQWFPVGAVRDGLVVERPLTERYEPGQIVNLLGIVGQPFRFRKTLRNVMLLAYDTPPTPLLMTIPALLANQISVTLVLLGVNYGTAHLPPEVEVIVGEADMQWGNRVVTVGWADQVFICVNPDDEINQFTRVLNTFRELRNDIPPNYLFGAFRPPLPCGVGACTACLVRGKQGRVARICTDGPALDLMEVAL